MSAKTAAKKKVAKTAAKKRPAKEVKKKGGSRKAASAKRSSRVSPEKARRGAEAEWPDDEESVDAPAPHEHVEPRELSHARLLNRPEETAMPDADDDLVDDVAAGLEGGNDEEEDEYA